MNRSLKTVLIILILIGLSYGGYYFYKKSKQTCPPGDTCVSYTLGPNGKPLDGSSMPTEPGLTHTDFASSTPNGLPAGMPVDPKPIKVLSSFIDSRAGDVNQGEPPHTQITYSYTSLKNASTTLSAFSTYLTKNGYTITATSTTNAQKITYILNGDKSTDAVRQSAIISVTQANSLVSIVNISVIMADIIANPK